MGGWEGVGEWEGGWEGVGSGRREEVGEWEGGWEGVGGWERVCEWEGRSRNERKEQQPLIINYV